MYTKHRMLYGQTQANPLSRFVAEIPEQYTQKENEDMGRGMYGSGYGVKTYYSERSGGIVQPKTGVSGGFNKGYNRPAMATDTTIGKPIFEKKAESNKITFKPGERVKHHSFGEGEILSARQMGADVLYEVMFDKVGTKRLMATYARLQKI